ncbi:hypothetical protein [Eubacterium sp. 1001713B170207_170306_E7]|uniref:hypothetical protein n=1 Tax=Eubacterium sp. 1001713B170207_170306_E7 TaxID=2787097 RepID=UPI00189B389A|nr:hypothetical protein [Eubacterium sp. 1001713B170207_170306_E7]
MYTDSYYDPTTAAILSMLMAYLVVLLIIGIVLYIFSSISLYTMAKGRGMSKPWLAWIPIANSYLMGKLINEKVAFGSFVIPYAHVLLPVLPLVCGFLTRIPYMGWLFLIVSLVYSYGALYRLYKMYKPQDAVLYLVLSIIFAVTQPFFMFSMRKNKEEEYLSE